MRTAWVWVLLLACSKEKKPPAADRPAPIAGEARILGAPKPDTQIQRLALSADGRVALVIDDKGFRRFELASGTVKDVPVEELQDAALSADGKQLAIATSKGITIDGTAVALPKDHDPTRVAFTADGRLLALTSGPERLHLLAFDAKRAVVGTSKGLYREWVQHCDLTVGANDLAVVTGCNTIVALRVHDGVELAQWDVSRTSDSSSVAEVAPGQFVVAAVVGEDEQELEMWVPGRGRMKGMKDIGPCAIAPSGRIVACQAAENELVVIDTMTQTVRMKTKVPEYARALRFTGDGAQLVVALVDGRLATVGTSAVDAKASKLPEVAKSLAIDASAPTPHDVPVRKAKPTRKLSFDDVAVAIVPDAEGKQLAVSTGLQDVFAIDANGAGEQRRLFGWSAQIKRPELAWSPDAKQIAVAESDEKERLSIYTVGSDAEPKVIETDLKESHIAWSSKGLIATGGPKYGLIQIWDAKTLAKLRVLEPPGKQWLGGLAFAPDGRLLSWGDWAPTVVWNAANGAIEHELSGHAGSVLDAKWSRDGRWLATVGRDNAVIIWDGSTLAPLAAVRGMEPRAVAFSPDGNSLAISDGELLGEGLAIVSVPDGKPIARMAFDKLRTFELAWPNQIVVAAEHGLAWLPPLR